MAEDTPPDEVLRQLKKLREGKGLTTDRLKTSPAVLSAIATSDPVEALNGIKVLLDRIGTTDQAAALRVDFGLSLPELLGREPSSREAERLGERRAAYAELVGRDVKTLARWSDRALAELRGHLLADFFDGQVVVAAGVRRSRIIGIEVMQYDRLDEHLTEGHSISYSNPQTGSSLPLLLYGFPRDWKPTSIRFIVSFLDVPPERAWALVADTVMDVSFGHERTELDVSDGMARCRIENPRRDQLYGVFWGTRDEPEPPETTSRVDQTPVADPAGH